MRGRLRERTRICPVKKFGIVRKARISCLTYHYRCKNCNYDFTEQQSFTDDPITVCPECGEEQVRKVYSAVPIEFKGSGFYRTDKSK